MSVMVLKEGSKMDKAVKLVKAQRAIADLATAGSLDVELLAMHDTLGARFNTIAESVGITEHSLLVFCKAALGE